MGKKSATKGGFRGIYWKDLSATVPSFSYFLRKTAEKKQAREEFLKDWIKEAGAGAAGDEPMKFIDAEREGCPAEVSSLPGNIIRSVQFL